MMDDLKKLEKDFNDAVATMKAAASYLIDINDMNQFDTDSRNKIAAAYLALKNFTDNHE